MLGRLVGSFAAATAPRGGALASHAGQANERATHLRGRVVILALLSSPRAPSDILTINYTGATQNLLHVGSGAAIPWTALKRALYIDEYRALRRPRP